MSKINVNKLTKEQTINSIIHQANSMNKKLKKYDNEGIEEYRELITNLLGDHLNSKGTVSKAKESHYKNINILELKKTLNTMIKINNHEIYGTFRKYNKAVTESKENTLDTIFNHLVYNCGFNENEVRMLLASDDFLNHIWTAFKDLDGGYGSLQTVEKIYLNYDVSMKVKDKKKALSNIEYSLKEAKRIEERIRNEQDYKKYLRGKNRR